jgi:hypothetical protein
MVVVGPFNCRVMTGVLPEPLVMVLSCTSNRWATMLCCTSKAVSSKFKPVMLPPGLSDATKARVIQASN